MVDQPCAAGESSQAYDVAISRGTPRWCQRSHFPQTKGLCAAQSAPPAWRVVFGC